MFLGHFALGVATKPVAPTTPIWALFLAPQAIDLAFLALNVVDIEGSSHGDYGQSEIDALYSHSLLGALIISAVVFWAAKKIWKSDRTAWIIGALSFSHWPIDLIVHHKDLPILPNNIGDLPLLGFGLWDHSRTIISIEIAAAIVGVALYFNVARKQRATKLWFLGPAIITALFALMAYSDLGRLPA